MAGPIWVDGVDLATLGFVASDWDGDLAAVAAPPALAAAVGAVGARVTGAPGSVPDATLTVRGSVLAATPTLAQAAWLALVDRCAGGAAASGPTSAPVTLRVVDTTLEWVAYLDPGTRSARAVPMVTPKGPGAVAVGALTFRVPDPARRDATATTLSLSTTIARGAVGTLASGPVITLAGSITGGTSRTVTLTDGAGATRGTLTITPSVTIASGDSVEIDCARETVTQIVSGVRTARAAWLLASTDFFALDPAYVLSATNPGLTLSAGSGSATYRRRWR